MTRVLVLAGPEPQPPRDARARDLRPRDARRDPRRDRDPRRRARARRRLLPVEPRGRADRPAAPARLRRRDRQRRRPDPHQRRAARRAARRSSGRSSRSTCPTRRRARPFRQVNFLHDIALESIVGQGARGLSPGPRVDRPAVRRRPMADRADRARAASRDAPSCAGSASGSTRSTGASSALLNERAELAREAGRAKAAGGPAGDPRRRARARGPAPGDDGQRRAAAAGGPAGALPAADGRDPRARGARPSAADRGRSPTTGRERRRSLTPDARRRRLDPVRPGADRLPPPRPRRERDLRLGAGARPAAAASCCGSRTTTGRARRPEFDAALLEDLAWLGFVADAGPVRQSDDDAPYAAALERLRGGRPRLRLRLLAVDVRGVGARPRPALARAGLPGRLPRSAASTGPSCGSRSAAASERWMDRLVGPCADEVGGRRRPADPRPRRQLDVRVRGRRRRPAPGRRPRRPRTRPARATPAQIRLGAAARTATPPATFAHHPLVRRPDGRKLSKADGDTGGPRAARGGPPRAGADRRGRRGGRADRCAPADRGDRGRGALSARRPRRPDQGSVRSSISQAWSSACQAIRRAA